MLYLGYYPLNLEFLWGVSAHTLEQTRKHERVWLEGMEFRVWTRTEGIICSSVVATDTASWIPVFGTETFTCILGKDQVCDWPSMEQKSMIDFCIVSADLLSDVLDVWVKRGGELSTDHHLLVCSLRISKPVPSRKSRKSTVTYRIKWVALEKKSKEAIFIQYDSKVQATSKWIWGYQDGIKGVGIKISRGGGASTEKKTEK